MERRQKLDSRLRGNDGFKDGGRKFVIPAQAGIQFLRGALQHHTPHRRSLRDFSWSSNTASSKITPRIRYR
jgi:hypothetical protein